MAAITAWFWGGVGTVVLLLAMGRLRGRPSWQPIWVGLSVATLVIWTVATILAVTLPVIETGTDPTRIPVAAIVAPIAAAILTALAGPSPMCSEQDQAASSFARCRRSAGPTTFASASTRRRSRRTVRTRCIAGRVSRQKQLSSGRRHLARGST